HSDLPSMNTKSNFPTARRQIYSNFNSKSAWSSRARARLGESVGFVFFSDYLRFYNLRFDPFPFSGHAGVIGAGEKSRGRRNEGQEQGRTLTPYLACTSKL